jgi:spermidine synthase
MTATDARSRRAYLGVLALLAVSFMLFQIAVLRELRFQLSTVFTLTPFLFSGVVACIGLGSLAAERIGPTSRRVLGWSAALLPVLVLPLFYVVIAVPQAIIDHGSAAFAVTTGPAAPEAGDLYLRQTVFAFLAVALLGYGPLFFLQGVIFTLYFREGRQEGILSNVYAADLVASGAGALIGGGLCFVLTPVQTAVVAAGLFLVTLWVASRYLRLRPAVLAVASLATLSLGGLELGTGFVQRMETPAWLSKVIAHSQWTRYRRIDVVDLQDLFTVYTDNLPFQHHLKSDAAQANHPRALPAVLTRLDPGIKEVLILGAGTGADVRLFRHLVERDLRIVAVELDGGFVDTARLFPWLWETYRTAEIVVQEGRYYLERSPDAFDLVLYAYIDPQSAISNIGLPDANFMYTDTGLRRAWDKVRPGGYFVLTRVFLVHEEAEFVRRLCATLQAAGVPPEDVRLYRGRRSAPWGYYGELATVYVLVKKGGPTPTFQHPEVLPVAWASGGRPTTDFFPMSMVTGVWFGTLVDFVRRSVVALGLVGLLAAALAVRIGTSAGHFNFFVLGFGSFLLESLVLFYSFLLLGDPNLSAAVAVGVFLVWNGIGSLLSRRLEAWTGFYVAVPLVMLLYVATAPALNALTIAQPIGLRTLAFSLHLALGGLVAGAMFPIALRSFRGERVSSMFFIDLVGCALAPLAFWLALSLVSIWLVGAATVASYAVVALTLARRRA